MAYKIIRTDTADLLIRKIIHGIAYAFDVDTALKKLDEMEDGIKNLGNNPYMGIKPRDRFLKRQGYRMLILDKNGVFYKVDDDKKTVIVYAVIDLRQDYVKIIKGL